MQHCGDGDLVGVDEVEDAIRESTHERPAGVAADDGMLLGMLLDEGEDLCDFGEKLASQTRALLLIPNECIGHIRSGPGLEHKCAVASAPRTLNLVEDLPPRASGARLSPV